MMKLPRRLISHDGRVELAAWAPCLLHSYVQGGSIMNIQEAWTPIE